jgi:hypothetical protein
MAAWGGWRWGRTKADLNHPRFQRLLDELKLTEVAARRWGR